MDEGKEISHRGKTLVGMPLHSLWTYTNSLQGAWAFLEHSSDFSPLPELNQEVTAPSFFFVALITCSLACKDLSSPVPEREWKFCENRIH